MTQQLNPIKIPRMIWSDHTVWKNLEVNGPLRWTIEGRNPKSDIKFRPVTKSVTRASNPKASGNRRRVRTRFPANLINWHPACCMITGSVHWKKWVFFSFLYDPKLCKEGISEKCDVIDFVTFALLLILFSLQRYKALRLLTLIKMKFYRRVLCELFDTTE